MIVRLIASMMSAIRVVLPMLAAAELVLIPSESYGPSGSCLSRAGQSAC